MSMTVYLLLVRATHDLLVCSLEKFPFRDKHTEVFVIGDLLWYRGKFSCRRKNHE